MFCTSLKKIFSDSGNDAKDFDVWYEEVLERKIDLARSHPWGNSWLGIVTKY